MNKVIKSIDELDPEFAQRVVKEFLKIAGDRVTFEWYTHATNNDTGGVHIFVYETVHGTEITKEIYNKLKEYCNQDDDNQPNGCFRVYFGAIWHMIPYCA